MLLDLLLAVLVCHGFGFGVFSFCVLGYYNVRFDFVVLGLIVMCRGGVDLIWVSYLV